MNRSTPPIVWIVCSLIVAAVAIFGVTVYVNRTPDPDKLALENPDEVRREILEAFRDPKTNVEVPGGVKELFERAGEDLSSGGQRMGEYFDIDRFTEEINRDGALDRIGAGPKNPGAYRQLKQGMLIGLPQNAELLAWDTTEFRAWKWLRPEKEAVAIVQHRSMFAGEQVLVKMRWWLILRPKGWQLYDFEDIAVGGRSTVLVGSLVESLIAWGPQRKREIEAFTQRFKQAKEALLQKDFAQMEEVLKGDFPNNLPPQFEAILHLWRSIALAGQAKAEEALAAVRRAEQLDPSIPMLAFVRALAHNELEQYEEALAQSKVFMDLAGPDDVMLLNRGLAFEGLNRTAEARDAYSRSIDELPSEEAISGLRRCLDPDRKGEFAAHVLRLPDPEKQFRHFINETFIAEDYEAAKALLDGYAKLRPNDVELIFQRARLEGQTGELAKAQPLFLKAIERAAADDRGRYLNSFVYQMQEKGKALEAHAAVSDADVSNVFNQLAGNFLDSDSDEEKPVAEFDKLEQLIKAHRKRKPNDPLLNYYTAHIHFSKKEYDEVERLLAEAMAKDLDDDQLHPYRWLRVRSLYKAGKGLIAYRTVGPAKATFNQLAHAYQSDSNTDGLDALVAAHRQAMPQDPNGAFWRGQVHFLRTEYADAVKQFERFRSLRAKDDYENDWQSRDGLIRSLVRLKRFAEAQRELDKDLENYNLSLLRAVVPAVAGKVGQTEAILDELAKNDWLQATFYSDPDLGPVLRSAPFAKVRVKFPPPKDDRPLKKT